MNSCRDNENNPGFTGRKICFHCFRKIVLRNFAFCEREGFTRSLFICLLGKRQQHQEGYVVKEVKEEDYCLSPVCGDISFKVRFPVQFNLPCRSSISFLKCPLRFKLLKSVIESDFTRTPNLFHLRRKRKRARMSSVFERIEIVYYRIKE